MMSLFNPQIALQIQTLLKSFQSTPLPITINENNRPFPIRFNSSIILIHQPNFRFRSHHSSWISIICILLLLMMMMMIQSCSSEPEIVTVDVHKANHLLRNEDYRYLDVRTLEEFMKGHVDFVKVLNIPYMVDTHQGRVKNGNFLEQVLSLCSKGDHLLLGCQSGVRSVYASKILLEAGFEHVYNMGGGYLAWVENDLPVTELTPKVEL